MFKSFNNTTYKKIEYREIYVGPFTIFAPTNNAFNGVDPTTLNSILKDVNLHQKVLAYHIVASFIPSSAFNNEVIVHSASGENLRINVYKSVQPEVSIIYINRNFY